MYRAFGKRLLDLCVAVPALVLLFPLLVLIALGTWAALGAPVLFTQERPGRGGRAFRLIKFRTMSIARDAAGNLLPDDRRLSRWGTFLRSTSLDELPELLNVIAGSMSLIGPRPLLMAYLSRYDHDQKRRHEVLPGITGWAQIHGRNALSWQGKFALDVWYVDHLSLRLDLTILVRTFGAVLFRRGIHAEGAATMPEFRGNGDDRRISAA
ncbi:MAG TPA: sugar transferase [bacterium]|jgi:lipopolysaccharide/colanic/teichoic acid biosynthesis glycosyltransferase